MRGVWRTAAEKMRVGEMEVTVTPQHDFKTGNPTDREAEVCKAHSTDISTFSLADGGVYTCDSCDKCVTRVEKCGAVACDMMYCSECEIATRSSALLCFYCASCRGHVHEWFQGKWRGKLG